MSFDCLKKRDQTLILLFSFSHRLEGRAPLGELDPDHLAANLKRARDG